ncbi:hypothetical protein M9H77_00825 [Catharanthus roseus]|uniref:Uncharacterized protein n=1 Tax=Catharanthus roseus TaxID=4058 RepID=A0ACC0C3S7_CATRO|nr:hypothetical protein M9H77_00825 [Catharanthus roseus]
MMPRQWGAETNSSQPLPKLKESVSAYESWMIALNGSRRKRNLIPFCRGRGDGHRFARRSSGAGVGELLTCGLIERGRSKLGYAFCGLKADGPIHLQPKEVVFIGSSNESGELQYTDAVRSLPRPSPLSAQDITSPVKKDDDKEEEEDEETVEHLTPKELLQRHVKHAKRVRSRLREERLRRIARYKTRLALLLPPMVDPQLRNDLAPGN